MSVAGRNSTGLGEAESWRIAGGAGAPAQARRVVLSHVEDQLGVTRASDAALLVSEIVTNSVVHASVGSDETLRLELLTLADRVRITVVDRGSREEPRLRRLAGERREHFGLLLVEELADAWGFARGREGTMRVWCEMLFEATASSPPRGAVTRP